MLLCEFKGRAKLENVGYKSKYLDANYLNGGKLIYVDSESDVNKNDIIILWDGSQAGAVYYGFEGALGSTLKAFTPLESGEFIFQQLKRDQQIIFDKFRTPNIPHVIKTFTDEFIISRTDIKEQEKISEFFRNIDNLITLHQRE